MTEADAKKKWCPFAMQTVTLENNKMPVAISSANRFVNHQMSTCVASSCMAWRWKYHNGAITEPKQGYCGLAGEP